MSWLSLRQISKTYGSNPVLSNITLDVEEGEFISLVGESGCGKSTLLRILAGLEAPDGGEIELNGRIVNAMAPKERNIAMVFQDYALYPHMTVGENLATPLVMARVPMAARLPLLSSMSGTYRRARVDIDKRVSETARQLKIDHLLDRRPAQLSGGQRQRVALGRALVRNPSLFLMDEPLSNLDAKLRTSVRGELTELHRSSGLTFVYVTHDQVEALTMSTRVALMEKGRLLQVGTSAELYGRPANLYVAQFMGSPEISVLPGEVRGGQLLVGELVSAMRLPAEGRVSVGIRSEDLTISSEAAFRRSPDTLRFLFTQTSSEDLGHEMLLYGNVAEAPGATVRVRVQKGQSPTSARGPLTLAAPLSALHIFDAKGDRLQSKLAASVEAEVA